jgi:2,4-dienoyl-CoA reductase-like NADH-dependent reductase (Old Yellow Enzyme family)
MPSRVSSSGFKPLADTAVFTPLQLGATRLEHRIVQAPLTRMRAVRESDNVFAHGDAAVEYYSQRASKGGLQLTEATNISRGVRYSLDRKYYADKLGFWIPRRPRSFHSNTTSWVEACR